MLDIIDVDIDKETDEEEPTIEGRGHHHDDFVTTTEATTSTQRTTPLHIDECRLPYYPAIDPDMENAWHFGTIFPRDFEKYTKRGISVKEWHRFQVLRETAD